MIALQWSNLSFECLQCFDFRCYRPACLNKSGLFPGSSVVEQLTVNQLVGGSNPSRGATFLMADAQANTL
jgi:hypothetical protein